MTDDDLLRLVSQLDRQEDRRTHPYMDCCGKPWRECPDQFRGHLTVAVGLNLDGGLTDEEIDYLLANRLERAKQDCLRAFPWFASLDSVRQAALVNICFNMGLANLRTFKNALTEMAAQNYVRAAGEFAASRWASQVGQRAVELCAQIRTGKWMQ